MFQFGKRKISTMFQFGKRTISTMFQQQTKEVQQGIREQSKKRETLRKLDLFVLENSLRETTVGQLRGHTIDNKWKIYEQAANRHSAPIERTRSVYEQAFPNQEGHFSPKKRKGKMFDEQVKEIEDALQDESDKRKALRDLDIFVLDNSLRETTVGQLRGHTIEDKWKIYEQVKKVGFEHIIVPSFSHMIRVEDTFIKQLKEKGEDMSLMYAFTELFGKIDSNRIPDTKAIPIGLRKMKELGITNTLIEIDLVYHGIDYKVFTLEQLCAILSKWMQWIRENLVSDSRIMVNFRDFPDSMKQRPRRVLKVVNFLSSLPPDQRPFAIVYEEPAGKYFPEELGVWTAAVRKEMIRCGFGSGHLLVHIHEQWGMQDTAQLICIANGATGIWAGLCVEGGTMGHACSAVTLMNLIRLGNQNVLKAYNCTELRNAARTITKITTGRDPAPKQPIYGDRALDTVFGMSGIPADKKSSEFTMAGFFGEEPVMRMTTLASPAMIVTKLKNMFGEDPVFNEERGERMLEVMLKDLNNNRKEEYMSAVGLAVLFDRSGGKMTSKMSNAIAEIEPKSVHIQRLIDDVRKYWDEWDLREEEQMDEALEFDSFYNGFMAPYFGCYRCEETKRALKAIGMDSDGKVDWNEFCLYLKWAGRQYPDTKDAEELLSIAFRKGLIPAMQDEVVKHVSELPKNDDDDDEDLDFETTYM